MIAGMRLNYACGNRWVIGIPDRSSAIWNAYLVASPADSKPHKVGIAAVIF